jgi:dynein heavy chain, axonemal
VKNQWKIASSALFQRLDAFSERCQDLILMAKTIMQFNKLEDIQIGNSKGTSFTEAVGQIFSEFQGAQEKFCSVTYDVMDIDQKRFEDDFYAFRHTIKELERRIAALLSSAFDDCDTLIGKFKLIDAFDGLLDRPSIQDELERRQIVLIELTRNDFKRVNKIFQEGRELISKESGNSPISNNMPPIAGALTWVSGLKGRLEEPMDRLMNFP